MVAGGGGGRVGWKEGVKGRAGGYCSVEELLFVMIFVVIFFCPVRGDTPLIGDLDIGYDPPTGVFE